MITFLKNRIFIILLIIFSILILGVMIFMNDVIYYIHLHELNNYLTFLNREESNIDYLNMVRKYKLHRQWYEDHITSYEFDKEELKLAYITLENENLNEQKTKNKYELISPYILKIINSFRQIFQKNPIQSDLVNELNNLSTAYYFERNKAYQKALTSYELAFNDPNIPLEYIPIIILHEGFCHSIIGNYQVAEEKYLSIINQYNKKKISITAAILLQYITDFQNEIKKLRDSDEKSLVKSEKFFKLIAFNDALNEIEKVEKIDEDVIDKITYIKARCYEETGKKQESIKQYQTLINKNPESESAKQSNRRMLILSTEQNNKELKKLVKKNNELIKDEEFNKLSDITDKIEIMEKELIKIRPELDAMEKTANSKKKTEEIEINNFISKALEKTEKQISKKSESKQKPVKPVVRKKIVKKPIPQKTVQELKKPPEPYKKVHKDKNGKLIKLENFSADDKLTSFYTYEYNDTGKLAKMEVYDDKSKLVKYYVYTYPEDGSDIEITVYDNKGNKK